MGQANLGGQACPTRAVLRYIFRPATGGLSAWRVAFVCRQTYEYCNIISDKNQVKKRGRGAEKDSEQRLAFRG